MIPLDLPSSGVPTAATQSELLLREIGCRFLGKIQVLRNPVTHLETA